MATYTGVYQVVGLIHTAALAWWGNTAPRPLNRSNGFQRFMALNDTASR